MDFTAILADWSLGLGGGFIAYVLLSLLGYGIGKAFHLLKN